MGWVFRSEVAFVVAIRRWGGYVQSALHPLIEAPLQGGPSLGPGSCYPVREALVISSGCTILLTVETKRCHLLMFSGSLGLPS